MPARATVITMANHKGGCAKTTSVANLGAAFAERHRRVLLIDADPQANLSEIFGLPTTVAAARLEDRLVTDDADPRPAIHRDMPGGVDLIPCSLALESTVTAHTNDAHFPYRMRALVDRAAHEYDAIIIDTPPGVGPLSSMAMVASDWVIVPARPADFDVTGAIKIASLIHGDLRRVNDDLRLLGVLLTQSDRRWTITHDTRDALDRAGVRRLRTEIPARVAVGAAPRYGAPTFVLQPDGVIALAYRTLAAELDAALLDQAAGA
jgi:chromosome partitioning protein